MNFVDRTVRVHMACHAGSVQRRSHSGKTSLLTRGAQGIRFACLQAQTDIGQPIQVVPIEIPANSGPFTCVPGQTVEDLVGEDQRLPSGWALWAVGLRTRQESAILRGTHRAPWGGKSSACEGSAQVVLGIAVTAGKMWAGQSDHHSDLGPSSALSKQLPHDPQIHDAPIGLRKALPNLPSLDAVAIDLSSLGGGKPGRSGVGPKDIFRLVPADPIGGRFCGGWRLKRGLDQSLGMWGQAGAGVQDSHPRSIAAGTPLRLLVGEAGQPAQMTPVGTRRVAIIHTGQISANRSCQGRFQGRGADANPGLEMSLAGLHHDTRVMSVGAHEIHGRRIGTIQIDQNIASVLVGGVRLDVHVATLAVASAQKPDSCRTHQQVCGPKSFPRKRTACLVVNQADQVQLVGHCHELAADGLSSQKESTVVHDRNCAIEAADRTMNLQRTANSVLTVCLTSGGRFKPARLFWPARSPK